MIINTTQAKTERQMELNYQTELHDGIFEYVPKEVPCESLRLDSLTNKQKEAILELLQRGIMTFEFTE